MQVNDSAKTQQMFGIDADQGRRTRRRSSTPACSPSARQPARRARREVPRVQVVPIATRPSSAMGTPMAAHGPGRRSAMEPRARESVLDTTRDHVRSEVQRDHRASPPIRSFLRSFRRRTRSTCGTSASRARCSRSSGAGRCIRRARAVPEGFDAHPKARYPLIINHGHFP